MHGVHGGVLTRPALNRPEQSRRMTGALASWPPTWSRESTGAEGALAPPLCTIAWATAQVRNPISTETL